MNITIYENIFKTNKGISIPLDKALERIKNGKSKIPVEKIRTINDKEERNKLKQGLPCVVFGGTFSTRSKNGLIDSSGFAILDFDDIDISYKEKLRTDKYIYSAWVSPSGNGIKALVKIPIVKSDKEYKEYYEALLAEYEGANIDKSTKDISRVSYESFDKDIFVNTFSSIFEKKIVSKPIEPLKRVYSYASDDDTYNKLIKWIEKSENYISGNRNNYLNKLAYACNTFGLNKSLVVSNFKAQFDLSIKEIERTVNSAYKDTSVFNTQTFDTWDKVRDVKKMIKDNVPIEQINEIADKEIISIAIESIDRKVCTFWHVADPVKGIIKFHLEKFINWLEGCGYFKHLLADGNFILININNNIVSQVYRHDIRRFLFDYINSLPFEFDNIYRTQLQEWFFSHEKKIISENTFELLTTKQIDFFKDNKTTASIFFKNTIVLVDNDNISNLSYDNFEGYIWNNQIIQRDFELKEAFKDGYGMFETFIIDILGGNNDNIYSFYSAIGYLIHSYKPTSFSPAIVLNDKMISDDPNGGTGKGIISKAISQYKNSVTLDGKTFDFNKAFAFQRVELSTDLMIFDDVKSNFDFENLFSVITEGITVEKKNKGEFFIPFDKSPKILMTTNYALKGEGNSIERRKVDFELEQYYTKEYTPYNKFGKMFFSEWDKKEWLQFDSLILFCIQYFLKNGIVLPKNINLNEKRLLANTNADFIDFINSFSKFNEKLNKKDFHDSFISETNMRQVKSNTLTKWVKTWCKFKGFDYEEGKYNGVRNFIIKEK